VCRVGFKEKIHTGSCLSALIAFAFAIIIIAPGFSLAQCLDCHGDKTMTTTDSSGHERSLFVNDSLFQHSSHASVGCQGCHKDVTDVPHPENLAKVNCGECHSNEAEQYKWHGRLEVGIGKDIPTCADCHGKHDILPQADKDSHVNPLNLPGTCGHCHENLDLVKKHNIPMANPIEVFETSVHGKASLGGIYLAATCNDCHSANGTAHMIYAPGDTRSSINHFNIPKTCGRCHRSIEEDYWEGIHGKLTAQGETDSPVCTECHGEHGILSPKDPLSPVSPARIAEATCAPCHESARLNEKYGVPTGRLKSWVDSYHGLKSKAGDLTVANCASCHGAHRILPQTDPSSSVNPANLQKTCGNCHPGISTAIASTPIHGTPGVTRTHAAAIFRSIYIWAIIIIIGTMIVHWLIDLRKQIYKVSQGKQIIRMHYDELWQHTFLMVTFTVLVITGFSLRFSEAWWVQLLFGWEGGFPLRGIIHRVAAVLFILTAIWHVFYMSSSRGRKFIKDIFPAKHDIEQFFDSMKYNLGISKNPPAFGRFSYIEKAEYWALVWGTAVMIITGFFLWFENVAVKWFPKGFLDVMLIVHYYEAWLAFLAVLIWHMYSTVFSPTVYPMNPSWYTGRMPLEMYQHEHAADPILKDIKKEYRPEVKTEPYENIMEEE
jgi:cytochrome b subunit of formate dehydrogenase